MVQPEAGLEWTEDGMVKVFVMWLDDVCDDVEQILIADHPALGHGYNLFIAGTQS